MVDRLCPPAGEASSSAPVSASFERLRACQRHPDRRREDTVGGGIVDASELPDADGALANIVMLDVFHHLADPARFLDEATRTLAVGGRVVMVEPYCSPVSTRLYKPFHHERTDLHADPFAPADAASPLESNQARPTLVSTATARVLSAGRSSARRGAPLRDSRLPADRRLLAAAARPPRLFRVLQLSSAL